MGSTIADVGDVNGDGVSDVAVGAAAVDAPGRTDAGVVYVVFGGTALGRLDLRTAPGFRIVGPRQGANRPLPVFASDGPPKGSMAGSAVAGAGDVNADGLADILVGAPFAGRRGRAFSGSAYVVFGKRSTSSVDLQRLGRGGFRIDGPRRDAAAATEVAGVGDVNGDGRADVVGGLGARAALGGVRGVRQASARPRSISAACGATDSRSAAAGVSSATSATRSPARATSTATGSPTSRSERPSPARRGVRGPARRSSSSARGGRATWTCGRSGAAGSRSTASRISPTSARRSRRWATSTATGAATSSSARRRSQRRIGRTRARPTWSSGSRRAGGSTCSGRARRRTGSSVRRRRPAARRARAWR